MEKLEPHVDHSETGVARVDMTRSDNVWKNKIKLGFFSRKLKSQLNLLRYLLGFAW